MHRGSGSGSSRPRMGPSMLTEHRRGDLMAGTLPDYIASAKPVPLSARQPWYKNTAPTYAGIFLWFVFWDRISQNGLGTGGLMMALLGVFVGAIICHAAFYIVPGMLGMKTGLPLYV